MKEIIKALDREIKKLDREIEVLNNLTSKIKNELEEKQKWQEQQEQTKI